MSLGPLIVVGDTVMVTGETGRWVVDVIHLGNANQVDACRGCSYVVVSQAVGGGNGYPYATEFKGWAIGTALRLSDPRLLAFVRRGNVELDARYADGEGDEILPPSPNVVSNGVIRRLAEIVATARRSTLEVA